MVSPLRYGLRAIDSTRSANSSGRPMRLGNTMLSTSLSLVASGTPSISGVPIVPGAIAHTRTPIGARSRAMGRVMPRIAAFAAAYAIWPV